MAFCVQVHARQLDAKAPVVTDTQQAAQLARAMCVIQQHRHPMRCRSYMIPCFVTSCTNGQVSL